MNPETLALALQIVSTALQINLQGTWRASVDFVAFNDQSVHVSLYPAHTDFELPVRQWPSPNHRGVVLAATDDGKSSERLQALADWLRGFLTVTPEEAAA
ncbi:hypothetical protein ACIPK7_06395 [Pseudomonas sp. NPDC086581]|uniref:hypothetical protein n=1 Tax=Pseudomonas sp. NPDC086581 TaxID=3364432 RepID=UPI0037F19632